MDVLVWAALLAAPDFKTREASSRLAEGLAHNDPTLAAVGVVGEPEAERRAEAASDVAHARLLARLGPYPQLDMGWHANWRVTKGPLERALDAMFVPSMRPFEPSYEFYPYRKLRLACREWASVQLDSGTSPELLGLYLHILRTRDQQFYSETRFDSPYRVPSVMPPR
jgi:hypothetical protein